VRGLLLAGGHGTRLRPLTFTGNKHMIPIANEPMLFYGLRHLADAGIRDVAIVLGTIHEGIPEAVGDGAAFGLRVTYIHQGEPKGLAHAVKCAREFLGEEPFVMYLGDNLLQDGAKPLTEEFLAHGGDAVIGVTAVPDARQYGVVEMDGDRIVSIVEKPPQPRSNLALIGVYLFTSKIHGIIAGLQPSARGELEITEAIWQLHRGGGTVRVRQVTGWWKDTGRPQDLLEANAKVLRSGGALLFARTGEIAPGAEVVGPVGIGAGSVVAAGCRIEGPAVIGRGVRVEGGARIGPCTAVGDRSLLRGVSVAGSILLEGAVLEGRFRVRDSIIGRDTEITGGPDDLQTLSCVLGDAGRVRLGGTTR
jgi:glucose-1-phosphate thymidylyltransferase